MPSAATVAELAVVVSADTKPAETALSSLGQSMKTGMGMGIGLGVIEKGLELVGSAFSAAKGSIIDLNSSLEQSQIAFTTMLGSGEKASAFLDQLKTFAANTPFEFPDLVSASKRMLAFGFESAQVVPLLTAVGDAVAAVGGGAETIDGVTTAIGQMQAKGKVSAEEMGQLAERGIPAWDMLAKQMGVSVAEAMDAVSKGQVKAGTFVEAFQKGSADRFGGMMEKQAMTFAGAMSTIMDSLQMATATAFKPFFELLSEGAVAFSKLVQSETFTAWAGIVSAGIAGVVAALRGLFGLFMGGGEFVQVGEMLDQFFPPAVSNAIMGAVDDLGALFEAVFAHDIPGAIEDGLAVLEDFGGIIVGFVESWASSFAAWVDGAESGMMDGLAEMAQGLYTWLGTAAAAIVEKLVAWGAAFVDWIGPKIPDLLRALGGYLADMLGWMLGTALPAVLLKLAEWGLALVEWVAPRIGPLLLELGKLLLELGSWLITTALPAIVLKLAEWGAAFVDWVGPKIPPLLVELGKFLLEALGWVTNTALPRLVLALVEWGAAFVDWIAKDVLPSLPEKLGAIVTAIGTWISEKVASITESAAALGAAFLQGIQDGIASALGAFWSWLQTNFVDKIPGFVKDLLGIKSPSSVFAEIGRQLVEGLRVGMEQRLPSIDEVVARAFASVGGAVEGANGEIAGYIANAARLRGIDPVPALKVAQHEGGLEEYNKVGKFNTGWSSWPFQLHYAMRGMPGVTRPTAGMGDDFTRDTGWQFADPKAWKDSIDYALDHARRHGWGAWYGRVPAGVGKWEGIPGHAAGGWAGLNGPELAWLGERGPEYVVPNHALGAVASSTPTQAVSMPIVIGGRTVEELSITGRDLAIRRGRVPGAGAAAMGSLG